MSSPFTYVCKSLRMLPAMKPATAIARARRARTGRDASIILLLSGFV
jgi:hypothetical protein